MAAKPDEKTSQQQTDNKKAEWSIWKWSTPIVKPASFVVIGGGLRGKTTWITRYFSSRCSWPSEHLCPPFVYIDGTKLSVDDHCHHPLVLACMYRGGEAQTFLELQRPNAIERGQLFSSDFIVISLGDFVRGLKGQDAKCDHSVWQELNARRFNSRLREYERMVAYSHHLFMISELVPGGTCQVYVSADAVTQK